MRRNNTTVATQRASSSQAAARRSFKFAAPQLLTSQRAERRALGKRAAPGATRPIEPAPATKTARQRVTNSKIFFEDMDEKKDHVDVDEVSNAEAATMYASTRESILTVAAKDIDLSDQRPLKR